MARSSTSFYFHASTPMKNIRQHSSSQSESESASMKRQEEAEAPRQTHFPEAMHFDNDSSLPMETDADNPDKMVAQEIERLPQKHRNAIQEEIHGVSSMAIEETPELLETSLRSFQTELDRIDPKSRFSYDLVAHQESIRGSQRIFAGPAFRLRFLRRSFFRPKEAAHRMVGFFHILHDIYGHEAFLRFDGKMGFFVGETDVLSAFRAGYIQILPFRDRSGRKVLVLVMDALQIEDSARLKIFLYLAFVAGEDEETQRNGIVILFWPGSRELQLPPNRHRERVGNLMKCLPTRITAFHFCFPDTTLFKIARTMLLFVLKIGGFVTRAKVHIGERVEVQYQLMGYGIPVNLIPTTATGTLKTKNFVQWVSLRKILDSYQQMPDDRVVLRLECPGLRDVIFRSAGKSCMLNPGNVAFRSIFERYHDEHITAGQTEKKKLVWRIVEEIEAGGGRFLVWDKLGCWMQLVDRTEIRKKVAISLRGYNKRRRAEENRQSFPIASKNCSTRAFEGQDDSLESFQRGPKRRKNGVLTCVGCSDSDESIHSCDMCGM